MILRLAPWKLLNVFWMNDFNGRFAMYFWCHWNTTLLWYTGHFGVVYHCYLGYHRYSVLSQWDSSPFHWSFLTTEMQHNTKPNQTSIAYPTHFLKWRTQFLTALPDFLGPWGVFFVWLVLWCFGFFFLVLVLWHPKYSKVKIKTKQTTPPPNPVLIFVN